MPKILYATRKREVAERDADPNGRLPCAGCTEQIYTDLPYNDPEAYTLDHKNGDDSDHRLPNMRAMHRKCNTAVANSRRAEAARRGRNGHAGGVFSLSSARPSTNGHLADAHELTRRLNGAKTTGRRGTGVWGAQNNLTELIEESSPDKRLSEMMFRRFTAYCLNRAEQEGSVDLKDLRLSAGLVSTAKPRRQYEYMDMLTCSEGPLERFPGEDDRTLVRLRPAKATGWLDAFNTEAISHAT